MNINLTILKEKIDVTCETEVKSNTYTFSLAAGMYVSEIVNNGIIVSSVAFETVSLDLRPKMKKYTLNGLSKGILQINYSGVPEGNFAFLEDEFIHFSLYNGWYPTDFDVKEDYEVSLRVGDEYKMLKATFDEETKYWHYTAKLQPLQDCNIICVNTFSVYSLESDEVTIYWYDSEKEHISKAIYTEFVKICNFYRKLYGSDKIGHMDIVFVPGNEKIGAYMREGLIVFSDVTDIDQNSLIYTLGHEIGHAYASGADTNTYDDWLNETGAEWSSYLYLLENKTEFFKGKICACLEDKVTENHSLCIKECGEERPENVHLTGTLIYYEIYKKFGKEAVAEILRIFDRLDVKKQIHLWML